MRRLLNTGFMIGVGFVLSVGITDAASFNFDFTGLAIGSTTAPGGGIQAWMQGVVGAAGTVTVTQAGGGGVADNSYAGDGHVVGPSCLGTAPSGSGQGTCGVTLGNPLGNGTNLNTYIKSAGSGGVEAGFTFAFALPTATIDSVTFDYEIFPDGTCTKLDGVGGHCGGAGDPNQPDFTFGTNLNPSVLSVLGSTPAVGSHGYVVNAAGGTSETAPQKLVLGTTIGGSGVAGDTCPSNSPCTFTFMDWPATIGVDNFVVNYHTTTITSVPEPMSIFLLGTVTFFVSRKVRRKTCVDV